MMKIEELIKQPISQIIDLMVDLPSKSDLIKAICAFSNTNGGYIVIGVDPLTKAINGLDFNRIFDINDILKKDCIELIEPTPQILGRVYNINSKLVYLISVQPGSIKPYFLKNQDKYSSCYIRNGRNIELASKEQVDKMQKYSLFSGFDVSPVYEASVDDLDFEIIEAYVETREQLNNITKSLVNYAFLENNRLIVRDRGKIYPTVSAILCFSNKPQDYLPNAQINCCKFFNEDITEPSESTIISGNILNQASQIIKFYQDIDIPQEILLELVLNAIIHRDYSSEKMINIAMFEDSFEIDSPGFLEFGMELDDLGKGISVYRNQNIFRIFRELGLGCNHQNGLQYIKNIVNEMSLSTPEYLYSENGLIVTVSKQLTSEDTYINNEESRIIEYLYENEFITNENCQKLLKIKGKQAQYMLVKLLKKGKIVSVGEKKGRKYILAN